MTREEFLKTFPLLVANYKPSAEAISRIGNVSLLMIVGPSGVGKTTIVNFLGLPYVPADNSRPRRPEEREGIDYFFRSDYDRIIEEIKSGKFVQVAIDSGGDLKATRAGSYPISGTAVLAVVSDVIPILRTLGFAKTTSAFITPQSYDEWIRRLDSHQMDNNQIQSRLAEAKRSFSFALSDNQMHFILNEEVGSAIRQLNDLVAGKSDEANEKRARQAAELIYQKLA